MPFSLDPARWVEIESLPLPVAIGNLSKGLCAVARIVYASTGKMSDAAQADCIAPSIRSYMIVLNDKLPDSLRSRLGTLEMAQRVLAADTSKQAEQRRRYLCADAAVRVFAVNALRSANLNDQANTLANLPKIVDKHAAYAADAVAYAAAEAYAEHDARALRGAYKEYKDYGDDAAYVAAHGEPGRGARAAYAAYAAGDAAYVAARVADSTPADDDVADAAYADEAAYAAGDNGAHSPRGTRGAYAAYAADAAAFAAFAADAAVWEPAFDLLSALLAA